MADHGNSLLEKNFNHNIQKITIHLPLSILRDSIPQKLGREEKGEELWHSDNCVYQQSLIHNLGNFERSVAPERLMYHRSGKWLDFTGEVVKQAQAAFLERNSLAKITIDGNKYVFDFYRMLQIDAVYGFQRSIAWIDTNNNCFFPKIFVDDCVDSCCKSLETDVTIRLVNKKLSGGKRKKEGKLLDNDYVDTADSSLNCESASYKSKRRCLGRNNNKSSPGSMKWPNVRMLKEGEKPYVAVENLFLEKMRNIDPDVEVTSIYQFSRAGPMERARSEIFQRQMENTKSCRGGSNAIFAWHGTSKEEAVRILSYGFGKPSNVWGPKAHGIGVYLSAASLPHLSHELAEVDDNGERHVMLCRVIVGKSEKIEVGSQQSYPSNGEFDIGVDDVDHPNWYVVWTSKMNTHIIPECIVSYKCSSSLQGVNHRVEDLNGATNSIAAAKLLPKLTSLLPPTKVECLKLLYRSYMDGTMEKDSFIKGLRSVAGDRIMHSVAHETKAQHGIF